MTNQSETMKKRQSAYSFPSYFRNEIIQFYLNDTNNVLREKASEMARDISFQILDLLSQIGAGKFKDLEDSMKYVFVYSHSDKIVDNIIAKMNRDYFIKDDLSFSSPQLLKLRFKQIRQIIQTQAIKNPFINKCLQANKKYYILLDNMNDFVYFQQRLKTSKKTQNLWKYQAKRSQMEILKGETLFSLCQDFYQIKSQKDQILNVTLQKGTTISAQQSKQKKKKMNQKGKVKIQKQQQNVSNRIQNLGKVQHRIRINLSADFINKIKNKLKEDQKMDQEYNDSLETTQTKEEDNGKNKKMRKKKKLKKIFLKKY